ncbi:c-Myc-binding protein-like isoform X1 [Schistocerca americana]|uniref:c-Myc-binding protein-like isoform X1 n=1 Tax=Schistocerca americana TaxID=7009 RepID=UPI001F4F3265|nr:c-Myc-binding protein-like isoform X1 [Schistocerca americana]XP_049805109.1 c-Myc-binding protein-like isoform X1 [Schistocerca nitens]
MSVETHCEEFRKYLEKGGVMETFTRILVSLYEEKERPAQPLDYIKNKMRIVSPESTEIEALKNELQAALATVETLTAENRSLKEDNSDLRNRMSQLEAQVPKTDGETSSLSHN